MTRGSLKLRLLLASAISVSVALVLTGVGLQFLFERHVESRVALELKAHLRQLVSAIKRRPDGTLQVSWPLAEARFSEPLSGLYWQVSPVSDGPPLRSRSLWDSALTLPKDAVGDGEVQTHSLVGPSGEWLFAVERTVEMPISEGAEAIRAVVAVDRLEIKSAGQAFINDLKPFLAILAAVLLGAGWLQVTLGLRPLDTIRSRLADVRSRRRSQLGTGFPDELLPLTAEVDMLLAAQEETIRCARARAANLAHSLRTPLTALQGDVEALRSKGDNEIADDIASIASGMLLFVERELAQARSGASLTVMKTSPVEPVVEQIVRVLHRSPAGRTLDFQVVVPPDLCMEVDMQDLTEIVGSLGENAMKWARGRVVIAASKESGAVKLTVDDDGPGIPESEVEAVQSRGGRLSKDQPGSGLGLAIVGDLAKAYGGSVCLGASKLGGLRAEVLLPIRSEPNSIHF